MSYSLVFLEIVIILFLVYFFFLREYFISKKEFKCLRCGECCKLRVKLTKEDIEKIKKEGHKDFFDKYNYIKQINGYCNFLTLDKGITSCKIEKIKPEICKRFPNKKGFLGKKRDYRCKTCWGKLA